MADTLSYRNTHNLSRCNRTAIGSGVSPPRTCRAASILRTVQARSADNTDAGASEGIGSPVQRPMFLQVVTFQRWHQALCGGYFALKPAQRCSEGISTVSWALHLAGG